MKIRLLPPAPHPTILYGVTFPHVLPLQDLGPGATMPPSWSSQLQILTSVLQLEPPSSIHMLDRAVCLVARADEVIMDVPRKEFALTFVDGRVIHIPMNSDCVRMLLGVVVDVKGCSESESQRNSMEGSACHGSTGASAEDIPSGGRPPKPHKPGKHKRQRSLLFSLISSLVPKSFSSSPPPPPSSAPPRAALPPLPISSRVTSPISPQRFTFVSEHPEFLRRRARATLADVWRRHVVSAIAPQHMPAAGYAEWVLIAMASNVRAELESLEIANFHNVSDARTSGNRHRTTQSEGRKALDFGDRSDDCGPEQWRCRAPSPFPGMANLDDTDQVVYPRQEQADEWGVRSVRNPKSIDDVDIFAVEYSGHNDSLLGEHFAVGDDWDDTERLTFELTRFGCHNIPSFENRSTNLVCLHAGDFRLDCSDDDGNGLVDTAFDVSRCPLIPTDVDDEQSDDSQISLRTPEDGEDLPLVLPTQGPQGTIRDATYSASRPPSVARVGSSRPRSRNPSAQYSGAPFPSAQPPRPSTPLASPSSSACRSHYRNPDADELITSHLELLDRICAALELVRSRAREEGWRTIRATSIGAANGWMNSEAERSLEIKAKRRAWSSGIKVSAPYSTPRFLPKVRDGSLSTLRPTMRPPGLAPSKGSPQLHGPIVPTGLSLGVPVRSSPLALYSWAADDGQEHNRNKYGILNSGYGMETIKGKRTSRVTFADNTTTLFPVCEDDSEDLFEPIQVNAIGFPQVVPVSVAADEPECSLIEGPAGNEDDPFYFCPSRPRTRTQSMYMQPPTPSASLSPVLPMFRPSTPPPSYQSVVCGDVPAEGNDEGRLDASALLLQPLSSLSISSSQPVSSVLPPVSKPRSIPRPRAVSLPTPRFHPGTNTARRTSSHHRDERCEDLSQAYASPPPEGPLVVSAGPAPHEQYPRYAHVYSPIPASKKNINTTILERTGKEVVFEQAGSEFAVGIEVALGRAEEGRAIW